MATGGRSDLTQENKNFTRATFLVFELGTNAVKEVFDQISIFEPKDLSKNLEIHRKTIKKKLLPFLQKILYPSEDESKIWKSADLDLTMLVALIDTLDTENTPPPTKVLTWKVTKKNIKDIKDSRNELAHSKAAVTDQRFDEIWENTKKAILSLVDEASKQRYEQKIEDFLRISVDLKNFNKAEDYTYKGLGLKLQEYLKDHYLEKRVYAQFNPLNPESTMPVDEIYIKTVLSQERRSDDKKYEFSHYKEIFQKHPKESEKQIKKVLVIGKAGAGKTMFSIAIMSDWANDKEPYLNRFEALFLLTMRNVKPTQSLVEMIKEQLLHRQSELEAGLKHYIENNSDKCLFILDGLDELGKERSTDINDILKKFYLNKAYFLITSRPWLVQDLVVADQVFDKLVRIEGFDPKHVKIFIKKLFDYILKSSESNEKAEKLCSEIKEKKLSDLVKIPLILIMVCLLFLNEEKLPNNTYKLYRKIREHLYQKQTDKSNQNDAELHDMLMKLGKLAFEGLLKDKDQLLFDHDELIALVGERPFKIGFLSLEKDKFIMGKDTLVSFMHKSVQENFAAYYVAQETEGNNEKPWQDLKDRISNIDMLRNKAFLLEFMAGESMSLYGKIRSLLDEMLLEALQNGYGREYGNDDVTHILQLHSNCLKSAQTTKHPEYISDNIRNDDDLEKIATSSDSLSWIYLQGKNKAEPFDFTEKTVSLLSKMLESNTNPCSVYFGGNCKLPYKLIKETLKDLAGQRNLSFTYITFGAYPRYVNEYEDEEWVELFKVLLGFRKLLGIGLYQCDIPGTVLETIGEIIKRNSRTLYVLNLAGNHRMKGQFNRIAETQPGTPLVLSWLNLNSCIDASDSQSVSRFLLEAKNIRHLFIGRCECEISDAVLELRELRFLWIADTVRGGTKKGLDVRKILQNLHLFPHLESIYAAGCSIEDSDLGLIQVEKLSTTVTFKIDGNKITDQAAGNFQQICQERGIIVMWK